jgi:Dynein heavy chain, N-terminal region 2
LQILSQASRDPLYVEIHLRKLFENIVSIILDEDDIVEIASSDGEQFKIKRVKAWGCPVERWLLQV